ncbi:calcium/sodium antiporter [Acholeplasma hippikon]|uniref:Inner membrane protein yrbG n=1 Tax=Acholeplasma hippikon TaxID=264636 RepID=A0A449BIU2_9MOLU|nr:calcium/sodium antiporter [Acholeplasma hippikon]VEU82237.1 Inner membrane protein yrbG [Acholeplasma hippikon]
MEIFNQTGLNVLANIMILIVGGLILIKCADIFVDSASSLAKKLKISTLVIGLTIVALGTSLPELAVSLVSAIKAKGTSDLALGNVIGSNIVNITLILGIGPLFGTILVGKNIQKRDIPFMILATVMFVLFGFLFNTDQRIVWYEGIILLLICALYIYILIRSSKNEVNHEEEHEVKPFTKWTIPLLIIGAAGIAIGAELVTTPATYLAETAAVAFGMTKTAATTLVGLTIVAVGTSLPELMTTIAAAKKGQNNMILGNVIGSNILNILFIIGLSSTITNLKFNEAILIDLVIMLGVTIFVSLFAIKGKLTKNVGLILIVTYIFYVVYLVLRTFGVL